MSRFKEVLSSAGRELLVVGATAAAVFLPGLLQAPNLDAAYAIGIAALVAAGAAVLKALQAMVPAFSWSSVGVPQPVAAYLDIATRVVISSLFVIGFNVLNAPTLHDAKLAFTAGILGIAAAVGRALQGALTPGEAPFSGKAA